MDILNRTSAPQILRFFDICFKEGVIDAYEFGDDFGAKEFYNRKMSDWTFGFLGKEEDLDWKVFRNGLYWFARMRKMSTFADSYIFRLRQVRSEWCLLPYCMRFYLMGVKEWVEYPNPVNIEIFKGQPKRHWNPNVGMKVFMRGDYFSYMHEFAHEYRQIPLENKPVSDAMMDGFCQCVFDLSSNY